MIGIKLDKTVSCEYLCQKIQSVINDYQKNNIIAESILVIDIKPLTDSQENTGPLRVEQKNF